MTEALAGFTIAVIIAALTYLTACVDKLLFGVGLLSFIGIVCLIGTYCVHMSMKE